METPESSGQADGDEDVPPSGGSLEIGNIETYGPEPYADAKFPLRGDP